MPVELEQHCLGLLDELKALSDEMRDGRLAQLGLTADQSAKMCTCLAQGLLDEAASILSQTLTDYSAAAERASDRPTRIGGYEIRALLGSGGMGNVYRAEQLHPIQRTVAIKLIKLGMDTREVVSRFQSERQTLARMDHPNIAHVLEAGSDERGRPYFVMEFVPGVPITRFADEERLTIHQRLNLFLQVCDAITHAHTKAILHRDIKASNVLAYLHDGKPFVKIIDFGIAKALAPERMVERTFATDRGAVVGTIECMSPEQIEGSTDIDTRTDVYALGVLLYELLVGALPFDSKALRAAGYNEVRRVICEAQPPKPSTRAISPADAAARVTKPHELARLVARELEWIPLKALRKDRSRRYQSVAELAEDVQNYLAGRPLLAGPESRGYRARKWAKRHAAPVATATAALVLLIGAMGFYIHRIRAEQARTVLALAESNRQTSVAAAVSRFQADMLSSASPDRVLGDKVTVVQVITAAAAELDAGKLSAQPLVEAAVREMIGNTLWGLSRYAEAEANLRRALEIRRRVLPSPHPEIATNLFNVASAVRDQGKLAEAEALSREALAMHRKTRPTAHPDVPLCLNSLASILFAQGKLDEAEPLFREALELQRRLLAPDNPDLALSLNNVGILLEARGKSSEAEPFFRDALAHRKKCLPPGHWLTAASYHALAGSLYAQGRFLEAEALFREGLAIQRKALSAEHPEIALSLNNLAETLRAQGRFAEAELLHREACEIRRKTLASSHPFLRASLNNLAAVLAAQKKFVEAESLYRESLRRSAGVDADHDAEMRRAHASLIVCLRELHRDAEADRLERAAGQSTSPAAAPVPGSMP